MSASDVAGCQGWHAALALINHAPERVLGIYLQEKSHPVTEREKKLLALVAQHGLSLKHVDEANMNQLADGVHHQGVYLQYQPDQPTEAAWLAQWKGNRYPPVWLLILDGVQDPHNLGACLRTAWAAGVDAVIAPRDRACGLTPVVHKVASGAAACLPYIQVTNLARFITAIKAQGVWVHGADEGQSTAVHEVNWQGSVAMVMGAEGRGMRDLTKKHCDGLFTIPTQSAFSTLNVSVATGIALFEALRQRRDRWL